MTGSPPGRDEIPATLLEYPQWLCWRGEVRDGKPTKVPVDPTAGGFASTTDGSTWSDYATAREHAIAGGADGVGFVFTESDSIVGVDLDDCRDPETGQPDSWATDVIGTLDSFTEVSPSGTGYHVLVAGERPEGRNRKGELEVYDRARFFTVTADHVEGTPVEICERSEALAAVFDEYLAPDDAGNSEAHANARSRQTVGSLEDDELLEKARNAANGEKFDALYRGSTAGYESQSEADMALCSLLAFWTGGDARQMDRLFRASGLLREKWDEQHFADGSTYGQKTIERAIAGTTEFYEPANGDREPSQRPKGAQSDSLGDPARAIERMERIEELQARLSEVLEENKRLQEQLDAERAKRRALETELEEARASGGSLFSWG